MRTLVAIATVLLLAGCKASAPAETTQQLMKNKVDPASKVYFEAVQYISDSTGEHDIKPQTDADWEKVRKAAADLVKGKLSGVPVAVVRGLDVVGTSTVDAGIAPVVRPAADDMFSLGSRDVLWAPAATRPPA